MERCFYAPLIALCIMAVATFVMYVKAVSENTSVESSFKTIWKSTIVQIEIELNRLKGYK